MGILRGGSMAWRFHRALYKPIRIIIFPCAGNVGCSPLTCMLMRALSVHTAHETAGAARIRHSLRPLTTEGEELPANLGRNASREREAISAVIPGRAEHEPGIHRTAELVEKWIPGLRQAAHPGMTIEGDVRWIAPSLALTMRECSLRPHVPQNVRFTRCSGCGGSA